MNEGEFYMITYRSRHLTNLKPNKDNKKIIESVCGNDCRLA